MSKRIYSVLTFILVFFVFIFCLSSCGLAHLIESAKMKNYYSEKSNYINVIGTIADIEYSEGGDLLMLEFDEDIAPADIFTSRKFLIEGENLLTIKTGGFDEKVEIGSFVEFTTVPAVLFGYARPIVSLTVDGETLLEFEVGYQALLDSL